MNAQKVKHITISLELSLKEARWLQGVMQNPVNGDANPANEDPQEAEFRHSFFDALSEQLDNDIESF